MVDTTFIDQETCIEAEWLNDVNDHVYDGGEGVDTSGTPVANDIARFTDADTIEGRSYAELKADLNLEIGTDVLAEQTIGIADDNLLEVDGTPVDGEAAVFTAAGLNSLSEAEFKSAFNMEAGTDFLAEQTIGIADDNLLEVDGSPNSAEYARFTANGLEGRTEGEFKADFNLEIGTDIQAQDAELAAIAGLTSASGKLIEFTGSGTAQVIDHTGVKSTESIGIACSDETTALTTGSAKCTFRMPYAFTLSDVRISVTTAPTGSTLTVDINESGSTILSTKLTIDISEKTSTTAATPAVISDSTLADDAEITIDIDQIGSTVAGAGLKVFLIGTRT